MSMSDPQQWLKLLQVRGYADADLLDNLNKQMALLARSKHPRSSDYEDELVPESCAERLVVLRAEDGGAFDPTFPLMAMHIFERALDAASIDIASKLVADAALAQESEEELQRRWTSWFCTGGIWVRLVKRNWFDILVRAAKRMEEWAKEEGVDRVDGAEEAVAALVAGVRKLLPEDIIPAGLYEEVAAEELMIDTNW